MIARQRPDTLHRMSLRPGSTQHRPDPRLGHYRDRVGRLFRGGNEVGLVLVQVQAQAEQVGGRLWWRRWGATRDALWLWTIVDGEFSDHWVVDGLDEELASYGQGRFSSRAKSSACDGPMSRSQPR